MGFTLQSILDPMDFTKDEGKEATRRAQEAEAMYGGVDQQGNMARLSGQAEQFGQQGAANFAADRGQIGYDRALMAATAARMGGMATQSGEQFGRVADRYGRLASGQDSVSAEQLRQSLQQNQAAQMSMAAGARPGNSAMAARTAALSAGRQGYGLAGQQAVAGLQERRDALAGQLGALGGGAQAQQGFMAGQAGVQQAMQQGSLAQRQQDYQAATAGQSTALSGYGGIEQQRGGRYSAMLGVSPGPSSSEKLMQVGGTVAQMYAASDRRLKKDVRDGRPAAAKLLKALKSATWRYKNEEFGEGDQLGIMAQDLERGGAGHAVVDTPRGKMVHGAKLATALAATLPVLDERIRKIEKRSRR